MANLERIRQRRAVNASKRAAWLKTDEGLEQSFLLKERAAALAVLEDKPSGSFTVAKLRLINKALDRPLTIETMWDKHIRLDRNNVSQLTELAGWIIDA